MVSMHCMTQPSFEKNGKNECRYPYENDKVTDVGKIENLLTVTWQVVESTFAPNSSGSRGKAERDLAIPHLGPLTSDLPIPVHLVVSSQLIILKSQSALPNAAQQLSMAPYCLPCTDQTRPPEIRGHVHPNSSSALSSCVVGLLCGHLISSLLPTTSPQHLP